MSTQPNSIEDAEAVRTPYRVPTLSLPIEFHSPASTVLNWSQKSVPTHWTAHVSTPILSTEKPGELMQSADRLICGENLPVLVDLLSRHGAHVDLIYIDPPFDSKVNYAKKISLKGKAAPTLKTQQVQYEDRWQDNGYLQFMYERLILLRALLNETGSIIIHCDRHRAHHLRCIADEIFGAEHFRGSMAWCYGGGGAPKRQYPSKHDTLLWFSKSKQWTFNKQFRPYSKATLARGLTKVKGPKYELHEDGAMLNDWWADDAVQKILSPTAHENLKYPTQKPEALLKRIIMGHSNPGDTILDCFSGSGTTLSVARSNQRHYIGIDQNKGAIATTMHRLLNQDLHAKNEGHSALTKLSIHCTRAHIEQMKAQSAGTTFNVSCTPTELMITDFRPTTLMQMLRDEQVNIDSWYTLVESVMIDPNYDGQVLRPSIIDIPARNQLIKAKYQLPPNAGQIQVWVTDVLSNIHTMSVRP